MDPTAVDNQHATTTQKNELFDKLFGNDSREIKLTVGTDVLLNCSVRRQPVKCRTKICGWREKDFLILATPVVDGKLIDVTCGDNMTVRFVNDGIVYGFNSVLLGKLSHPRHLWVMTYPDLCERLSLRKSLRVPLLLLAAVGGTEEKVFVLDLSEGGALLEFNEELRVGDRKVLSFVLPNGRAVTGLGVIVKNVSKAENSLKVGTAFDEESREACAAIREFLAKVGAESKVVR